MIDPIFDSQMPELTSDLEWMLQSGQAPGEMLAEALVQEFYPVAYRLVWVILGDPAAARSTLIEAFSNALLNLYRYRSQTGARAWFFHILQKELRKNTSLFHNRTSGEMQRMPGFAGGQEDPLPLKAGEFEILGAYTDLTLNQQLAVFFGVVAGWPVDEIALAMGTDKTHVNEWLSQASRRIFKRTKKSSNPRIEGQEAALELLKRSMDTHYPEEQMDEDDRARFVSQVVNRKAKRSSLQRRAVSVKEIFFTTLAILIVAGVIWGANQILPDNGYSQTPTETSQNQSAASFRRRSRFRPTATPLPHLRSALPTPTSQGMFYELKPGERLASVAARFGLSTNALLEFNRLPADVSLSAGDRIVLPPESMQEYPTPTPVTPLPKIEPRSTPNSYSDIVSAMSRENDTWQTLWMDAEMLDYGPPGFVGPPQVTRSQLWLSQSQFLALVGSSNGTPDVVFLRNWENMYAAQPGIGQIWFNKMQSPSSIGMLEDRLSGLFDEIFFRHQDKQAVMRIAGGDVIAGRNAWRVNQTDSDGNLQSRFWMDIRTGFILRDQTFGGPDHKTLLSEVRVTKIFFDVAFTNQSMFDPNLPWRGGYAGDYTGKPESPNVHRPSPEPARGHEPLQYIPAFGGFAPGLHSLTFQYPSDYSSDKGATQVDIFSGMHYLGHTLFGNPRTLICSRSKDGNQIAYVSQPSREPGPDAQVHVIDLRSLKQVTPNIPGVMAVSHFAFSPDSRKLAFFGYDSQFDPGSLYLMDSDSGKTAQLATMKEARSLVWSPDNLSLGFIGLPDLHVQDEVMVLDVRDAKITYSKPYYGSNDPGGTPGSDNLPMMNWGVEFPVSMGGLGDCVDPSGL